MPATAKKIKRHFYAMQLIEARADQSRSGDVAEIMLYEQIGKESSVDIRARFL